ncbi:ATPase family protein associated with various cellular activities (AAA) [Plasticicumulans lactativorans]|uniref:ATPase family protein associated with various cellular activities (AAA) n=1 Tax=Plasticicumulans lactativorans TaxID=1133106 RepID=A0A4R2LCS2_9GAMM|nr:ATP-binding protein [Plasticicumulans lactativorans]TCO80648.1 ATPase family protein associated with various cellular activities (AAA) [Plasticicumulans lactativorans]
MPDAAALRLHAEAGLLAGRLAGVLTGAFPQATGAVAEAITWLDSAFQAARAGRDPATLGGGALARPPADGPHPLDRLAGALALGATDVDLLLLAGMAEVHEGYAVVLRTLHPRGEALASVGLAAHLLGPGSEARAALRRRLEGGTLLRAGVLRLSGEGPFFERSLLPAEGLWSVLGGGHDWPAGLRPLAVPLASGGLARWFAGAQTAAVALRERAACTLLVSAETEDTAAARARALAAHAGRDAEVLAWPAGADAALEALLGAHALARGVVPVLVPAVADPAVPELPALAAFPDAALVCVRSGGVQPRGPRPLLALAAERPRPAELRTMWQESLPELKRQAPTLATRYPLEPHQAELVATDLRLRAALVGRAPTLADVAEAVRGRAQATLATGVARRRPRARWSDLILPADRLAQLREACARLAHRERVLERWRFAETLGGGSGVRLLFAGPPGTGKTLAVDVLASELGLDVLAVDLSRVVSKWIGETEKNLAGVFAAAEQAQAVLFFDEADALFGRRTEVSDAHDRYANLETAYLLARLERFEGLAVLATNLRQNLDPAFLRRLEFLVEFEEPDTAQRLALWRLHLPAAAPLAADVDLEELAEHYPLVGGHIRNAAFAAAFLAAAENTAIARAHLVHAIRREYEKAGRAFPGDFTER